MVVDVFGRDCTLMRVEFIELVGPDLRRPDLDGGTLMVLFV